MINKACILRQVLDTRRRTSMQASSAELSRPAR